MLKTGMARAVAPWAKRDLEDGAAQERFETLLSQAGILLSG